MGSIGLGLGLEQGNALSSAPSSAPTPLRIVPNGAYEAFVIAPHAELGAIAMHLIVGNGADASTPPYSIGAPFGGWRLYGYRILPGVDADPVSEATEVIYAGIGSQQYALEALPGDSGWGGVYHGGLHLDTSVPDLSTERYVATFSIVATGTIAWGGVTATVADMLGIDATGTIRSATTISSASDFMTVYLDMVQLANPGFTEATPAGGAPIALTAGDNDLAGARSIAFRNRATGTIATVTTTVPDATDFANIVANVSGDRVKLYPKIVPGASLGTVSTERTISFAAGEPDPPPAGILHWDGAVDGATGFAVIDNGTDGNGLGHGQVSFADGQLVFTRATGTGAWGPARVVWPMFNLQVGTVYAIPTAMTVSGGNSAGGVYLGVSVHANGADATGIGNATNGTPGYTFTATAATMYLAANQAWVSGSDNVLRIASIGPVAAI